MSPKTNQFDVDSYAKNLMEIHSNLSQTVAERFCNPTEKAPQIFPHTNKAYQHQHHLLFTDAFDPPNFGSTGLVDTNDDSQPDNQSQSIGLWNTSHILDDIVPVPSVNFRSYVPALPTEFPLSGSLECQTISDTNGQNCKSHKNRQDIGLSLTEIFQHDPVPESSSNLDIAAVQSSQLVKSPSSEISDYEIPQIKANLFENSKVSRETQVTFNKFSSLLGQVTAHNSCVFLVECLKDHHQHVSLDALFNLLYNENTSDFNPVESSEPAQGEGSILPTPSGIEFCRVILQAFHHQQYGRDLKTGCIQNTEVSPINSQELLRNFLAVKILFSSFRRCKDRLAGQFCLPKQAVYKVYYIICQKLNQRHGTNSGYSSAEIVMSAPKLGRLANLIYPNLKQKKIGKRGSSKSYYIGLVWNPEVVDQTITNLLALDLSQLRKHFSPKSHSQIISNPSVPYKNTIPEENGTSMLVRTSSCAMNLLNVEKPLYSFVGVWHKFPLSNCSPRSWKMRPNTLPEQSHWASTNMEMSLAALSPYKVDFNHIIEKFKGGIFSDDNHEGLSKSVLGQMNVLERSAAPKEAYLHLYFVILVMVFPVVMSADQEVIPSSKSDFRLSVQNCISKLESKLENFSCTDEASLRTFISTLSNMVRLNEMTSCKIKAPYKERAVQEMIKSLNTVLTVNPNTDGNQSLSEIMYTSSVTTALKSYDFNLADPTSQKHPNYLTKTITSIAKVFSRNLAKSRDDFLTISEYACTQGPSYVSPDISFQALRLALMNLHDLTLQHPLVSKLPMVAVEFIIREFTSSMQRGSLASFGKGDTGFAQEFFKFSWIFSLMYQEYVKILTQVVALGETLRGLT